MSLRWMRAAAVLFGLAPAAALAFETVDRLPFPSLGTFPAWGADPIRPWAIFGYAGLMYDSNALRRDIAEESDLVARYGIGGRLLTRIVGRQRLRLDGYGEYYDYDRFSDIDHFGYGVRGAWLWEIGNDINGDASYERRRRHADLGEFRVERRAMIITERYLVDGGWRFHPNWRVFAGFEHGRAARDSEIAPELESNSARASLTYRTPLGNAVGIEARGTRGDQRIGDDLTGNTFIDEFEEREISGTLAYVLGATLRVAGRVGHTERSYKDLTGRDFSGTTYRGQVEWLATQKLVMDFEAYRGPEASIDIDASHILRQGAEFGVSWAATFKLVFTARFTNERRLYQGDPFAQITGLPLRDDTLRIWRFGAGWEPQRHWQLGAGVDFGERTSNRLGDDYEYYQVMLNARFVW